MVDILLVILLSGSIFLIGVCIGNNISCCKYYTALEKLGYKNGKKDLKDELYQKISNLKKDEWVSTDEFAFMNDQNVGYNKAIIDVLNILED